MIYCCLSITVISVRSIKIGSLAWLGIVLAIGATNENVKQKIFSFNSFEFSWQPTSLIWKRQKSDINHVLKDGFNNYTINIFKH